MSTSLSTATLNLATLQLLSMTRKVGRNGAPSSQDWNSNQSENLNDHANLAEFINTTLLPILNALPLSAASGLEGATLFTSTGDKGALFYDSLTGTPLTVDQSIRYVFNILNGLMSTVTNLGVEITSLTTKLSATGQNDVAKALQGFQSGLNSVTTQINRLQSASALPVTAQVATHVIAPSDTETVNIVWAAPMSNDNYTVGLSVADPSGFLQVMTYSYVVGGLGINVLVRNTDTDANHTGTINVIAVPSTL